MEQELTLSAQNIIDSFLKLDIAGTEVHCPYFNNRRQKVRGGLKVNIGKGSPSEIKEEVKIKAKKQNINLENLNKTELKKFMVDNNLGIDCSAFAYYVLNEHCKDKTDKNLANQLSFASKGLIRKIISHFRPIINTDVKLLAHPNNSKLVELRQVQPGDFIAIQNYGPRNDKDHIAIIYSVKYEESPKLLKCTHSFQWNSEGQYGGGVRKFDIKIEDINKSVDQQIWNEKEKKNEDNETYQAVQSAEEVDVKRLLL